MTDPPPTRNGSKPEATFETCDIASKPWGELDATTTLGEGAAISGSVPATR